MVMRNIATAHATITRRMIAPAMEAVSSPKDIFHASESPARIMRMTGESMHIMTPVETITAAFSLCSRNALASSIDTVLTVSSRPLSTGVTSGADGVSMSSLRR